MQRIGGRAFFELVYANIWWRPDVINEVSDNMKWQSDVLNEVSNNI